MSPKWILVLILLSMIAEASTITVGPGRCDYTHIWEALDAANPGDTIEVQSGTYYENVIVDKRIILRGVDTGAGSPVVDAKRLRSAITLVADGVRLEGFYATGSQSCEKIEAAGIKVLSNNNIIANNTASNNGCDGIALYRSKNNILMCNNANNNNDGIYLDSSSNNTVTHNVANANGEDGIYLLASSENIISDNSVSGNLDGIGLTESDDNIIRDNYAGRNLDGIGIWGSDNNNIVGNNASNNDYVGIGLGHCSKNTIVVNNASNNEYGLLLVHSNDNLLYRNSLIDNIGCNAHDNGANRWDDGAIGNLYGDFDEPREGCRDGDHDGICNFAYEILGGSNVDEHPVASVRGPIPDPLSLFLYMIYNIIYTE